MTDKTRTHNPPFADQKKVSQLEARLLEELFDNAPDVAFFIKDIEGCYVSVNQSLTSRHGFKSKKEVIGKRPIDICEGDFGRIPTQQDTELLRTGKPLINHLEMQWEQPHKPVWCFTTKLPIHSNNNEVVGLIGISRDIRAAIGPKDIPVKFAAALQEFEANLSSEFSPSIFAKSSELTPSQLARLTKRLFGLTPTQLITKTRITAASRLLLSTQSSIADIARQCGFWDHSAFTRSFRLATGVTPSQFRRQ